ncbi:MAG: Do family serine endopeptidase [Gammaproteobacteria bacterium]
MRARDVVRFVLVWGFIGLAAGVALVTLKPDLFPGTRPVVQVREAPAAPTGSPAQPSDTAPVSYADAVQRAAPAVVNVYSAKVVTQRRNPLLDDPLFQHFFGEQLAVPHPRLQTSLGSGVLVSAQGYVLTNNHVIDGADEIQVQLSDGRTGNAQVVGTDPETDLAVLRINLDKLPVIVIGNSRGLRVGDVVLAIGNPFGVGQTVTQGIVSATGRHALGLNTFEDFIQTDAAINPGNSGGALINAYGQLVGINTAIFTRSGGSQGIGFAIPARLATNVLTQIIEHGSVVRGWLGIDAQDLTPDLAESFGMNSPQGFVVAGVAHGGAADQAGVRLGDVITNINGQAVKDARDALNHIARQTPGTKIQIQGLRDGRFFDITAVLQRRPSSPRG